MPLSLPGAWNHESTVASGAAHLAVHQSSRQEALVSVKTARSPQHSFKLIVTHEDPPYLSWDAVSSWLSAAQGDHCLGWAAVNSLFNVLESN